MSTSTKEFLASTPLVETMSSAMHRQLEIGLTHPELSDWKRATFKWFNMKDGFGFLIVDGVKEDVFVHATVVRASGLFRILVGMPVATRIYPSRKDRFRAAIIRETQNG